MKIYADKKGIKICLTKISKNKKEKIFDLVAREVPLSIILNGKKIITLQCTPENYKYLGIGFLRTSGWIKNKTDIKSIKVNEKDYSIQCTIGNDLYQFGYSVKRSLQTGIYQLKKDREEFPLVDFSLRIKKNHIHELVQHMQKKAEFFKSSGGTHSCVLANQDGKILLFQEDISRYNSIDKIIGEALTKNIDTRDKIIIASCRITSGILLKIISANIPMVISRAATTDYAVDMANRAGITLIGFVRGERMNVYSHPERLDL